MTADVSGRPQHIAVMDGLRGIAIAIVVLTHAELAGWYPHLRIASVSLGWEWLVHGGALGVELFFFISGFVLFVPYVGAWRAKAPLPSLAHFAGRRFVKIVPSYYFALAFQAAFLWTGLAAQYDRTNQLISHALFFHSYSPSTFFGIDGAFWSIAPEVQFYVVFPALAFAMLRAPIATFAALAAIANAYRFWLHEAGRSADAFYVSQLPAEIDLFAAGMLCAYAYLVLSARAPRSRERTLATLLALAATAAGCRLLADFTQATYVSPAAHEAWQSDHRVFVVATIAALALGSLFAHTWWQKIVCVKPLLWLSAISYNLYLWHEAIMTRCASAGFPCSLRPAPWIANPNWPRQFFLASIAISIAVAWALTIAFERPLLRLKLHNVFEHARTSAVHERPPHPHSDTAA